MTAPPALTLIDTAVFVAVVVPFLMLVRSRNAIPRLPAADSATSTPRVSVVIAARDEAASIGGSVASLLRQDYPDVEIVAVDDRSRDRTSAVLHELAGRDHRIVTIRIDELPTGWLGKNHALWCGAQRASGAWILFTDADVVFAPDAVRRAMAYATAKGLDHLTLTPLLVARGVLLRAFVTFFGYVFIAFWGAYRANDPRSRHGVGVGAFNLVQREAYEAIGTMRSISLRPDDDIRLGRRIRRCGFRQRLLNGRDVIEVEWYRSLGAAIAGLEKSLYASMEYRAIDAALVVFFLVGTMVWPFVGVVVLDGLDRVLLAIVVGCLWLGLAETYRQSTGPLRAATALPIILLPVSAVVFAYAIVRSVVLAERRGVSWRGTVYPLSVLRAQSGLEGTAANRNR